MEERRVRGGKIVELLWNRWEDKMQRGRRDDTWRERWSSWWKENQLGSRRLRRKQSQNQAERGKRAKSATLSPALARNKSHILFIFMAFLNESSVTGCGVQSGQLMHLGVCSEKKKDFPTFFNIKNNLLFRSENICIISCSIGRLFLNYPTVNASYLHQRLFWPASHYLTLRFSHFIKSLIILLCALVKKIVMETCQNSDFINLIFAV